MRRFLLQIFFVVLVCVSASAQERNIEHRLIVDIPFYLAGGEESDIRYDMDSVALANSLRDLQLLGQDKQSSVKSVEFYSSVSPEGTVKFNKRLGKIRLITAERMVRERLHLGKEVAISYDERYIPWHDYLLPAIKADSTVPYREQLLKLIYRPDNAKGKDNRRVNLKRTYGGKLWKVVEERYFDHIRKGGAIITIERTIFDDIAQTILTQPVAPRGGVEVSPEALSLPISNNEHSATSEKESHYALSAKTNVLGWGLGIMNIAAEIDFAKHWSLSLPIYYAAHNYFTPTIKFRTFATQPEIRYWIKENNMGFFAGAHFGVASYNIAVDGIKRYQDHAGKCPALGGGISIGYRMPLSKNRPNWQIEFTVGAGGYSLHYDTFYNVENGRLIGSYRKTYWGIDNAAINISYKFNLNKQKR